MRGERGAGGEIRRAVASRYWQEADARAVLAELDASGLGMAAFCRRYGVGRQRIRYWRGRLAGGEGASRRPAFLPVRVLERAASAGSEAIEIVVRGERTVRVRPGFDGEQIGRAHV